jgi:prepilin-type N-terminal cleavage/methylation domain-containing protein
MKTYSKRIPAAMPRLRGFSLIEVMVALIIIAVGMLGIAKMQALALSTTESSGVRSLVAIEAASLAATMHTNRDEHHLLRHRPGATGRRVLLRDLDLHAGADRGV